VLRGDDEGQAAGPDDASCILWAFGMFFITITCFLTNWIGCLSPVTSTTRHDIYDTQHGQRRPTTANDSQQRPAQAHTGQRQPTKASAGLHRPMTTNKGQRRPRPMTANKGQRRPTQAHDSQRRLTRAHDIHTHHPLDLFRRPPQKRVYEQSYTRFLCFFIFIFIFIPPETRLRAIVDVFLMFLISYFL